MQNMIQIKNIQNMKDMVDDVYRMINVELFALSENYAPLHPSLYPPVESEKMTDCKYLDETIKNEAVYEDLIEQDNHLDYNYNNLFWLTHILNELEQDIDMKTIVESFKLYTNEKGQTLCPQLHKNISSALTYDSFSGPVKYAGLDYALNLVDNFQKEYLHRATDIS